MTRIYGQTRTDKIGKPNRFQVNNKTKYFHSSEHLLEYPSQYLRITFSLQFQIIQILSHFNILHHVKSFSIRELSYLIYNYKPPFFNRSSIILLIAKY